MSPPPRSGGRRRRQRAIKKLHQPAGLAAGRRESSIEIVSLRAGPIFSKGSFGLAQNAVIGASGKQSPLIALTRRLSPLSRARFMINGKRAVADLLQSLSSKSNTPFTQLPYSPAIP